LANPRFLEFISQLIDVCLPPQDNILLGLLYHLYRNRSASLISLFHLKTSIPGLDDDIKSDIDIAIIGRGLTEKLTSRPSF